MTGSTFGPTLDPLLIRPDETATTGGFADALHAVRDVEGWLTDAQARVLYDGAHALHREGVILELGSYRGRSAVVLARAAPPGGRVFAVDPHGGDNRGPRQVEGRLDEGQADHDAFVQNVRRAGVADRIEHVRAASQDALGIVSGPIDLLYIDGAHQFRAARADIRGWGSRVPEGGTMLIHDGFSSVGVTLALLTELAASATWSYAGRVGSLVTYRRTHSRRMANLRAHLAQLAWFARNVMIKLALVTGQRWMCRRLGHDGERWPF